MQNETPRLRQRASSVAVPKNTSDRTTLQGPGSAPVAEPPSFATVMQQIIAERDALREQNDQLWTIIDKQRSIIQKQQTRISELEQELESYRRKVLNVSATESHSSDANESTVHTGKVASEQTTSTQVIDAEPTSPRRTSFGRIPPATLPPRSPLRALRSGASQEQGLKRYGSEEALKQAQVLTLPRRPGTGSPHPVVERASPSQIRTPSPSLGPQRSHEQAIVSRNSGSSYSGHSGTPRYQSPMDGARSSPVSSSVESVRHDAQSEHRLHRMSGEPLRVTAAASPLYRPLPQSAPLQQFSSQPSQIQSPPHGPSSSSSGNRTNVVTHHSDAPNVSMAESTMQPPVEMVQDTSQTTWEQTHGMMPRRTLAADMNTSMRMSVMSTIVLPPSSPRALDPSANNSTTSLSSFSLDASSGVEVVGETESELPIEPSSSSPSLVAEPLGAAQDDPDAPITNTRHHRLSRADMPETIIHQIDSVAEELQESVKRASRCYPDGVQIEAYEPYEDQQSLHTIDTIEGTEDQREHGHGDGNEGEGMTPYQHAVSTTNHVASTTSLPTSDILHTGGHYDLPAMGVLKKSASYSSTHGPSTFIRPPQAPVLYRPIDPLQSLAGIQVRVISSGFSINDRGREVDTFIFAVIRRNEEKTEELWRIEKEYSHFVKLDHMLKQKQPRKIVQALGRLPDKSLFAGHAPQKVDQRKQALEQYLLNAIAVHPPTAHVLCEFLSTNVKHPEQGITPEGFKEGYLTKRGKNFGGWKKRYFVLRRSILEYYESRDGPHLGTIMVNQCQVARQPSYGRDIDDKAYRHAFMLIETKKNGNITRHVLCAESDEERDSWVEYLVRYAANASEDAAEASRGKLRKLSKGDVGSIATERTASHSADSSTTDLADKVVSSSTLTPVEEQSETKPPMMKSATAPVSSNGEAGIAHPPAAPVQQNYRTEEVSAPPNPTLTRASVLAPREMGGKRNSREQQTSTTSTQAPKKKGFWGRMFHSGDSNRRPTNQPVFGVPLERAIEISRIKEGLECPAVVYRSIEYLEAKHAELEEGIYRLSGSSAVIRQLRDKFDTYSDYNILASGEYYDVHAVAGLLKLYLRELPVNILTREYHGQFIKVLEHEDRRVRVNELGRLVSHLPVANYTLLRALVAHLLRIVQKSDINKMNIRNVGIVFSPTLNIPADADGTARPRMVGEDEELVYEQIEPTTRRVAPTVTVASAPATEPTAPEPTVREDPQMTHLQAVPAQRTLSGRSKRNSILYQSAAPELVQLERRISKLDAQVPQFVEAQPLEEETIEEVAEDDEEIEVASFEVADEEAGDDTSYVDQTDDVDAGEEQDTAPNELVPDVPTDSDLESELSPKGATFPRGIACDSMIYADDDGHGNYFAPPNAPFTHEDRPTSPYSDFTDYSQDEPHHITSRAYAQ